jgi:glucosyl-dolichyl phosphate glucuronosyltransferase
MTHHNSSITIAICTRDNPEYIKHLVEDLKNQSDKDFELIIQNNGLKIDVDLSGFNNAIFLNKKCFGLSESRNLCVNSCKTEYIHFLDDDLTIKKDFTSSLKGFVAKNPNVSAAGGKVLPDWTYVDRPSWVTNNCLVLLSMLDFGPEKKRLGSEVSWLVGANLLIKTKKIIDYGFFKPYLGRIGGNESLLGSEENELLHRIAKDEDVFYCPDFTVHHYVSPNQLNRKWFVKRVAWQAVSDMLSNQNWLSSLPDQEERFLRSINCIKNDNSNIDELLHSVHFLTHNLLKGDG